jgi:hypothetical protein
MNQKLRGGAGILPVCPEAHSLRTPEPCEEAKPARGTGLSLIQPSGFVRTPPFAAVRSPSPWPSPAGRGSQGYSATASQTRRIIQRWQAATPLPAGEGRGGGERGPVENGPICFHGSGDVRLKARATKPPEERTALVHDSVFGNRFSFGFRISDFGFPTSFPR